VRVRTAEHADSRHASRDVPWHRRTLRERGISPGRTRADHTLARCEAGEKWVNEETTRMWAVMRGCVGLPWPVARTRILDACGRGEGGWRLRRCMLTYVDETVREEGGQLVSPPYDRVLPGYYVDPRTGLLSEQVSCKNTWRRDPVAHRRLIKHLAEPLVAVAMGGVWWEVTLAPIPGGQFGRARQIGGSPGDPVSAPWISASRGPDAILDEDRWEPAPPEICGGQGAFLFPFRKCTCWVLAEGLADGAPAALYGKPGSVYGAARRSMSPREIRRHRLGDASMLEAAVEKELAAFTRVDREGHLR